MLEMTGLYYGAFPLRTRGPEGTPAVRTNVRN
jgi:hypothetical protein